MAASCLHTYSLIQSLEKVWENSKLLTLYASMPIIFFSERAFAIQIKTSKINLEGNFHSGVVEREVF